VHDTTFFEGEGKPAVFVASDEFRDAAQAQADALGMSDVARVFVAHPIQDRTDAEMTALADQALDAITAALTTGTS
jgi:signal recognition particle GTPase